jgi:hypothetical protein
MKTIRLGILLVVFLSFALIVQAGAVLAEENDTPAEEKEETSEEGTPVDIDGDGEEEIVILDPSLAPKDSYGVDLDSDGDWDVVVIGTQPSPPA